MTPFAEYEPLTNAALDRLGQFLKSCKGGGAMNVEELDGFFAALIAGPETVMPSEYYPEVFGGEMSETCEFANLKEANKILGLMMRHWNAIAGTLFKDEIYAPVMLLDENGVANGNDWAHGFIRGTMMRRDGWAELVGDEQHGCMVPIFMLHYEHDQDPAMRPQPISPEQREDVIGHMTAALLIAYRYFRGRRQAGMSARTSETRRTARKVGRNDPCACGSGKKYKKCCGGAAVN